MIQIIKYVLYFIIKFKLNKNTQINRYSIEFYRLLLSFFLFMNC